MNYEFKFRAEFWWGLLTALGIAVFTVLINFDPATITDWQTWAIGAGGGVIRAVAGAAIGMMTKDALTG